MAYSAAKIIKSEFAVSAVIALLVTAFVHTSSKKRAREGLAVEAKPNLFKVFAVTLCAAYLIMFILMSNNRGPGGADGASLAAASSTLPGIDSAIKEAMRYVDVGDPDF